MCRSSSPASRRASRRGCARSHRCLTSHVFKYKLFLRTHTPHLVQSAGCVASLYMISPKMTLLTSTLVPLVIGIGTVFGMLLRRISNSAQQQGAAAAGVADEAF